MRTKKIFIYSGSNKAEKSNTLYLVKRLVESIKKHSKSEIKVSIFDSYNANILPCIGCLNCFNKGECLLDAQDGMDKIKKDMLEADLVIFATPIYIHGITGEMKKFIDRIAHWAHLMILNGKYGFSITTGFSNGEIIVNNYLKKIMIHFGLFYVGKLNAYTQYPNQIDDEEYLTERLNECSRLINEYLDKGKNTVPMEAQNVLFKAYKRVIANAANKSGAEYRFWLENGYFDCDDFGQLLLNTDLNTHLYEG